jgi:hypothetical protein
VEDKATTGRAGTVVQRVAVSRHHPLMAAATMSGMVLLYDLRTPRAAAASLKPHIAPMVRVADSCPLIVPSHGIVDTRASTAHDMRKVNFLAMVAFVSVRCACSEWTGCFRVLA